MDERFEILKRYNLWGENAFDLGYVRREYTEKLYKSTGNRLIKVLVGQRRVGKSYLLRQIAMHLVENGVDKKNTFFVNRELRDFGFLENEADLDALFKLYMKEVKPKGKIYLFIDEIQNIKDWERFVNSYSQDYTQDCEVLISGSNSKMLSGELATLLSGRYIKFKIFPFSYDEYLGISGKERERESYIDYINIGGMPEMYHLTSPEIKDNYITSLRDTILLRDIITRYKISDANLLEDIFVYVCNNASNMLSINNVVNYFKSKGRKCSYETVAAYLKYIKDAFLIYRVDRFRLCGKSVVAGIGKYYVNDLAFRNFLYKGFNYGTGYQLENLIYLDLLRAEFAVYVGDIKGKEVDFVASHNDRIVYIQSTYMLTDEATTRREYAPLEAINDSFEKYVVSMDDFTKPIYKGIRHIQAWNVRDVLKRE
jgi:predicted AAA+ superfamily ATPase